MTWLEHRYAVALIDGELARLRQLKLDTAPRDPRRAGILRRIDALLDQRNQETRRGQAA